MLPMFQFIQSFARLWIVENICRKHVGELKKNLSKSPVSMLTLALA